MILYLGIESCVEGSQAAKDLSLYVQEKVINDETTRRIFTEQVTNAKTMISSAFTQVEENYNETMWWPPIKHVLVEYYERENEQEPLEGQPPLYANASTSSFMTTMGGYRHNITSLTEVFWVLREKYDTFNVSMTQLTDWSAMGLGTSGFAFGSVAQLVMFVFTFIIAFIGLGIRAVFFVTSLFYLLSAEMDPVERVRQNMRHACCCFNHQCHASKHLYYKCCHLLLNSLC